MLYVFAGIDGSGKTTAAEMCNDYLKKRGGDSSLFAWNFFKNDQLQKEALKDLMKGNTDSSQRSEALTYINWHSSELKKLWNKEIKKVLDKGDDVVFDRYIYTPLVRGSLHGVNDVFISNKYDFLPKPDFVFYLDIDPIDACKRITKVRELGFWEMGGEMFINLKPEERFCKFQTLCRLMYQKYLPNNTIIIDGSQDVDFLRKVIEEFLTNKQK